MVCPRSLRPPTRSSGAAGGLAFGPPTRSRAKTKMREMEREINGVVFVPTLAWVPQAHTLWLLPCVALGTHQPPQESDLEDLPEAG